MSIIKKKMAIDFGNSNMKFAGGVGRDLQYYMVKSLAAENSTDNNAVVTWNNELVHFGTGYELCLQDKTERKYIEQSILLGAYKLFGPGFHDLDIAVGMPLKEYKSKKKDKFQERLNQIHNVKGEVNGESVTVSIRLMKVCAEGYSAFIALSKDIDKSEPVLLVDHGYKTTDFVWFSFYGGKWHIQGHATIKKGMLEVYSEMADALLNEDIELSPKAIEERLLYSPILNHKDKIDLQELFMRSTQAMKSIYNEIYTTCPDAPTRNLYLCGGAAEQVKQMMDKPNMIVPSIDKIIYCNAVGSYLQL